MWQWEKVGEALLPARRSREEAMHEAYRAKCICDGKYAAALGAALVANTINVRQLCLDIMTSLHNGRSEKTPVLVFAGKRGGEGKSMMLKALFSVFGHEHVFSKPECGSAPLVDLPGNRIVFFDDWRFEESVLSYAT